MHLFIRNPSLTIHARELPLPDPSTSYYRWFSWSGNGSRAWRCLSSGAATTIVVVTTERAGRISVVVEFSRLGRAKPAGLFIEA
jgi:hypothetical protein